MLYSAFLVDAKRWNSSWKELLYNFRESKYQRVQIYGKIMRCALFEILYLTKVYLVTD